MRSDLHKRWLRVTAVIVGAFGPVFFFGAIPETTEPARWSLDLLAWPLDGATTFRDPDTRFLSALTGGFLIGWGVTIWRLAGSVYDKAPEDVRRAVVSGLVAWFLLDSAGSLATGAASNVAFNAIVLFFAVGPLWRPARSGVGGTGNRNA